MNTIVRRTAFVSLSMPVVFSFGVIAGQLAPSDAQAATQVQERGSAASLEGDGVEVPMVVVVAGGCAVAGVVGWAGYRRNRIFA